MGMACCCWNPKPQLSVATEPMDMQLNIASDLAWIGYRTDDETLRPVEPVFPQWADPAEFPTLNLTYRGNERVESPLND